MCDFSLEAYRSRPAEEGEKLTLERFPSGSMGFTAGPSATLRCACPRHYFILQGIGEAIREACGVGGVRRS